MITAACVEAFGDLRELVGEVRSRVLIDAHWNDRDRGHAAISLEVARLRAAGVAPSFDRRETPKTEHGKATMLLQDMGIEVGYVVNAVALCLRGEIVRVPPDATADELVAGALLHLAHGDA